MKTIVITGGAGFVASHLADRILAEGHRVIALDNFVTGHASNIAHLAGESRFEFLEQDVSEPYTVEGPVDYVLHMASPASPIDYQKIPVETLRAGSFATHYALDLAKDKLATFLVASTSEIYGDPEVHPQKESYWGNVNTIGPRGCYDEAKRYAEAATMGYHRAYGLDTKIVRIFNTYGPRMRLNDGRVVPAFIGQALTGQNLTIFGDGSQTRSLCYVSDLVEGIWKLAQSRTNEPVNIGNPNEMTIKAFAQKVLQLVDTESQLSFKDLPKDDPQVRQPDIARAKELLDWEPVVSFEDGMEATIRYFQDYLQTPSAHAEKSAAI